VVQAGRVLGYDQSSLCLVNTCQVLCVRVTTLAWIILLSLLAVCLQVLFIDSVNTHEGGARLVCFVLGNSVCRLHRYVLARLVIGEHARVEGGSLARELGGSSRQLLHPLHPSLHFLINLASCKLLRLFDGHHGRLRVPINKNA